MSDERFRPFDYHTQTIEHGLAIPLTTSSDAHVPANIGKNLDRAVELARSAGYDHLVEYKKHRQIVVPI